MSPDILLALRKVHETYWEEMRAPCGHHERKARSKRESAERILRQKLAKYNPRDIPEYRLER